MKILLINPEKLISPPFGLLYIGSVLKDARHEVSLLEIPFGVGREERLKIARDEIARFGPGMVGITCMSMQTAIVKDLVEEAKRWKSDLPVVVGGVHPTIDPAQVLSWGADIAVRGEAESTVLELVDQLAGGRAIDSVNGISYLDGSRVVHTSDRGLLKDLNTIPPLAYDLLGSARFRRRSYAVRGFWLRNAWVMTARGCPGKCIFCASKTMHGRVVREFSIDKILDEVERLKKDYDIEGLWVTDDTFSLKERRVVDFCEGLKKRKIRIVWACQARVDTFTDGMAKAMRSAGCVQVDFGVESGSQKILDYIKKEINLDETRRAFRLAKENGLRVLATVIVGVPTETAEDNRATEEFLKEIRPNFVAPFFMTPYPGTELYDMAIRNGWLDASGDINWQSTEDPLMTLDMPKIEIKRSLDRLLAYNKSAIVEYLAQPKFLMDLASVLAVKPWYIMKIAGASLRGDRKDLMNLFLYIFRKEMLKN